MTDAAFMWVLRDIVLMQWCALRWDALQQGCTFSAWEEAVHVLHNLLHTTVAAARSGAAGVNIGGDSRAQTMSMAQAMRTPMPDRCAHQHVPSGLAYY